MVLVMNGIQSLDRGLEILKLLAEEGRTTASAVAESLGIHQSSASRLLLSLQKAGLVRKPDFHSFAPDFGLLAFAGTAMGGFPEVEVCAEVCGRLSRENFCCATAATLFRGRLIYLARTGDSQEPSLKLVDDSNFPISRSSLGLLLAYRLGRDGMIELLDGKLRDGLASDPEAEALRLHAMVESSLAEEGLMALRGVGANSFNYALDFESGSGRFAYALFSSSGEMTAVHAKAELKDAIARSCGALSTKSRRKGGLR